MRLTMVRLVLSLLGLAGVVRSAVTVMDPVKEARRQTPIALDDASYDRLLTAKRNYTSVVLLTALHPQFGCKLCRTFDPGFALVAKSWNEELFFASLDFSNGRQVFTRLQLSTAPNIWLFPPGSEGPVKFDFTHNEVTAEEVASWVTQHSGQKVTVKRPLNYLLIGSVAFAVLGILTLLRIFQPYLQGAFKNKIVWFFLAMAVILSCTSGHMYNTIRHTPYVSGNGEGGVTYIAGGFQNQFGLETQIVGVMYAILAFATFSLVFKVPTIQDKSRQALAVWIWSAVVMCVFSILMQIFRVKNGSYPFRIPPVF